MLWIQGVTTMKLFLALALVFSLVLPQQVEASRDDIFSSVFIADMGRKVHLPSRLGVRPLREIERLRAGQAFWAQITAVGVFTRQGIHEQFRKEAAKLERGDELKLRYLGKDMFTVLHLEESVRRRIKRELALDEEGNDEVQKKPRRKRKRGRGRTYRGPITWHNFGLKGKGLLAELQRGKSLKGTVVSPQKLRSFGKPRVASDPTGLDFAPIWRKGEPLWLTRMKDDRLRFKTRARNKGLTLFVKCTRWEDKPRRRGPRVSEKPVHGHLTVQLSAKQLMTVRSRERYRYVSIKPEKDQRRRLMRVFRTWDGERFDVKGSHIMADNMVKLALSAEYLRSQP